MRPVTAPCSHDPPTLQEILRCPVGMRSPEQDPPDKASDRPLMRPVTVALSSPPYTDPVPPSGGYPVPAQRPEGAPLQGAKVTNRISGESEPLMRRADESLSVLHEYDQQRRTRCGAWCEERARQPLAQEQRDKPGAYCISTGQHRKSKGGDVKRAGAEARTSEHDRPIFMNHKTSSRWGSPRGEGRSPVECNLLRKFSRCILSHA
jgi:hypothetical protein